MNKQSLGHGLINIAKNYYYYKKQPKLSISSSDYLYQPLEAIGFPQI